MASALTTRQRRFTSSAAASPAARPPGSSPSAAIASCCTRCVPSVARRRTRPTASRSSSARTRSRAPRRPTRTACSRPRCARSARSSFERPTKRASRAAPRSPSIATCSRRRCTMGHGASAHRGRCAMRSPSCRRRASSPPGRSRPTRSSATIQRAARRRVARVLRRDRADRRRRVDRSDDRLSRVALRQGDDGRCHGRRWWPDLAGEGAYLNCPFTREQYEAFLDALIAADQYDGHEFDPIPYFEGCMPVEEMARRGRETLRFGPMKPVGLRDPRTGRDAYAVAQLRMEDRGGRMWNLVGFQTRLRTREQQRVFRMIPGLAERGVPALRLDPSQLVRQRAGGPDAAPVAARRSARRCSPASSPASRATPRARRPGCSPASTSRGCSPATSR